MRNLIREIAKVLDRMFTPYSWTAEAAKAKAELAYLRDPRLAALRLAAHLEDSASAPGQCPYDSCHHNHPELPPPWERS